MSIKSDAVQASDKGFYKLSWTQRIGFGSGDLAQNLIYQTISMYLLFFYTNVYGLDPGVAAIMFLIVRIVDVIWDPLVGTFVDRIRNTLLLERILRFIALCIYNLCGPFNVLYSCQRALRSIERITHPRHQ